MASVYKPMAQILSDPSAEAAGSEVIVAAGGGARHTEDADRKNVLFVSRTTEYGGAEKHTLQLIRRLAGPDVRISILCLEQDFYSQRLDENQSPYIDIKCKEAPGWGLRSMRDWLQLLRDARPDVVVFVGSVLWLFPWYVPILGWLSGIPRRLTIAHLPPGPLPEKTKGWSIPNLVRRVKRLRRLQSLRVSGVFYTRTICVCDAVRDALVKDYRFPPKSTITIHNGVRISGSEQRGNGGWALRIRLGVSSEEFLLVCAARLSEQKGVDLLLRAIAQVLAEGVRCKCVIVGDGPLRKSLLEQALKLGLTGHVFFEGFQQDVESYLQAADAFVLTSHKEGLPLSVLEAMACGLPCIVTNVGGNAEAITDKVHGLVVPSQSVNQAAKAISFMATHPRERAEMSRMARARVREEFDIEDRMAEIKRVILN